MNVIFYFLLLLAVTVFAAVRGGKDERRAATVCVVASVATLFLLSPEGRFVKVEVGAAVIDLAVLATFVAIALRSQRFWPLWVAGLQLTAFSGHLLKVFQPGLIPIAYATAMAFWSYPILLIIAVGVARARYYRGLQPARG